MRWCRWLVVVLLVVGGTAVFPRHLLAHTELIEADPAPGAILRDAPDQLRLLFSLPVTDQSRVLLLNGDLQLVEGVRTQVDPTNNRQLLVHVPELPAGNYTVQWFVVAADGHEMSGSYAFGVRSGVPASWLVWGGTAVLLLVAGWGVWRRQRPAELSRGG